MSTTAAGVRTLDLLSPAARAGLDNMLGASGVKASSLFGARVVRLANEGVFDRQMRLHTRTAAALAGTKLHIGTPGPTRLLAGIAASDSQLARSANSALSDMLKRSGSPSMFESTGLSATMERFMAMQATTVHSILHKVLEQQSTQLQDTLASLVAPPARARVAPTSRPPATPAPAPAVALPTPAVPTPLDLATYMRALLLPCEVLGLIAAFAQVLDPFCATPRDALANATVCTLTLMLIVYGVLDVRRR